MLPAKLPCLFALAALLAGCASAGGDYPSLARRPAERAVPVQEPAQVPPAPLVTPALESRLARLVDDARAAHRRFEASAGTARAATGAAGAATRGSEAWTSAQVAVSALEGARSGAMVSLAQLDRLYADARLAYDVAESPEAARIAAAREEVDAWVAEESRIIAQLLRRIGG